MKLIPTKNISRLEWLELRRQGVGGSDVAAVLGLSPWQTPVGVYLSKVEPVEQDGDADDQSEAMYWGNVLEDVVAKEYAKRNGAYVGRVNYMVPDDESPLLANLDRAVSADRAKFVVRKGGGVFELRAKHLLECKTASAFSMSEWQDEVPIQYQLQCQAYMACTGAERCDIAALVGGQRYVQHTLERCDATIALIREGVTKFWVEHVVKGVPPPPMLVEDTRRLWPNATLDASVTATAEAEESWRSILVVREEIKRLEKEKDHHSMVIQAEMEDAESIALPCGHVIATWKENAKGKRLFLTKKEKTQ